MMIKDGKQYRNLQEQVQKNKEDIEQLQQGGVDIDMQQTSGTSTTAVMSQKATTDYTDSKCSQTTSAANTYTNTKAADTLDSAKTYAENQVNPIYLDLYDSGNSYTKLFNSAEINGKISSKYATSTFSGWYTIAPEISQAVNCFKFPITVRNNTNITQIKFQLLKIADSDDWVRTSGMLDFHNHTEIINITNTYETALTPGDQTIVFNTNSVTLNDGPYLILLLCNDLVTMTIYKFNDTQQEVFNYGANGWAGYNTNGIMTCNYFMNFYPATHDQTVLTDCPILNYEAGVSSPAGDKSINTEDGGKFNNLVSEVLTDKGVIDEDGNPVGGNTQTAEVALAKNYYLAVGDKFQLFYDGVIKSACVNALNFVVKCTKGKQYNRYWEFTPEASDVGTHQLKIIVRNFDGTVMSEGITNIIVTNPQTYTTPHNYNVLCFGDSLTSGGQWVAEGVRRVCGTAASGYSGPAPKYNANMKLTTYGKKTATVNTETIKHEGYGGWTWASFLSSSASSSTTNGIVITLTTAHGYNLNTYQKSIWTDNNGKKWELEDFPSTTQIKFNRGQGNTAAQSATTLPTTLTCTSPSATLTGFTATWESGNPFWDDEENKVNFKTHAEECGNTGADIAAVLLTWNGGGSNIAFDNTTKIAAQMGNAKTLLTDLHNDLPNCKVIVLGIQLPSLSGGLGYNYGANGGYADKWGEVFYAFQYNAALEKLVTEDTLLKTFCIFIDTKGQFDSYYNMPYSEECVNSRSTKTEIKGTNGVHPSQQGYYQIGDAFYRALIYELSKTFPSWTLTTSVGTGGSVSLSKTEGTVGETVYATIICNSGYTPTATLNGTAVTLTQNIANPLKYTAEITPIEGENRLTITFYEQA